MPNETTAERITMIAAATRVPLDPASAARVANAVAPTVRRLAQEDLRYAFETEPATFAVVARQDFRP